MGLWVPDAFAILGRDPVTITGPPFSARAWLPPQPQWIRGSCALPTPLPELRGDPDMVQTGWERVIRQVLLLIVSCVLLNGDGPPSKQTGPGFTTT